MVEDDVEGREAALGIQKVETNEGFAVVGESRCCVYLCNRATTPLCPRLLRFDLATRNARCSL